MSDIVYLIAIVVVIAIVVGVWFLRRNESPYVLESSFSPAVDPAGDFRLTIQDVFSIKGRGMVVTGAVETGALSVGQTIQIAAPDGTTVYQTKVNGLETFHRQVKQTQAGDNVGVLLDGLTKDQIKPGMVITRLG